MEAKKDVKISLQFKMFVGLMVTGALLLSLHSPSSEAKNYIKIGMVIASSLEIFTLCLRFAAPKKAQK